MRWIQNASPTFAVTGTVVGIRFPVVFSGTNIFRSNNGGGINMNHARITINGTMLFQENYGATIGGAMRIGEVTLVSNNNMTMVLLINCLFYICSASCYARCTLDFHQQQCFTVGRSYWCGKC